MRVNVSKQVYSVKPATSGHKITAEPKRYVVSHNRVISNGSEKREITKVAGETISGHKVICVKADGKAYIADSNTLNTNGIVGISTEAVSTGEYLKIQTGGVLQHNGWSFTIGEPIWCGANGVLTQTVTGTAFVCILGMAISADTINIEIQQPILL